MQSRWQIVLDPEASADARDAAWQTLRARVRGPVLFQLRRRIEGWRLTEDLADEVCERVAEHAGRGERATLRACVGFELGALLAERGAAGETDPEFLRDWASSLCLAALQELRHINPAAHRMLLRVYDRPEGAQPLTPAQLAQRLELLPSEVEECMDEGRVELRRLFQVEIGHTVSDPADASGEADAIMPQADALFG